MSREIPDWVKPGAFVVMSAPRFSLQRYGEIHKIEKVYKNGNFTIEGSTQQYRPWSDRGISTGNAWAAQSCRPLSDEIAAAIELDKRIATARAIIREEGDRLERLSRERQIDPESFIAEADAIKARKPAESA